MSFEPDYKSGAVDLCAKVAIIFLANQSFYQLKLKEKLKTLYRIKHFSFAFRSTNVQSENLSIRSHQELKFWYSVPHRYVFC